MTVTQDNDLISTRERTALSFLDVSKAFVADDEEFVAVRGINLEVPAGQFLCLLGPSGCGKSTLLNMAAGLMKPTAGTVKFGSSPIRTVNHQVGYVSQKDNLLPWQTVEGNIGLALKITGVSRRERRQRVDEMIESVGLQGFAKRYPSQLSGGMRKRVTLARTLVYNPSTLLMDEPFGALDAQLRASMQAELVRIWEVNRRTVLFVTHDVEEALFLADRVVVFGTKPGRIVADLSIPFQRPRDIVAFRAKREYVEMMQQIWGLLDQGASPQSRSHA